ncbi:hypothetical protein HU200_059334 [Digitaria exilis]|uniref:Peroxidase n=1 Tax=Digitaria exilis TaxID=1010633 RepID=A0A835E1M3_9POAL|nr:hypothetical protein HU200_059334 [Digitaria exilis]
MASFRLALFVAAAALSASLIPQPYYYANICPNLELIIRSSVKQSMAESPISAPAALRLFFHDCAVQGCDASIMIVNSNGDDEWRNPDNQSLKPEGFQVILNAKAAVDSDPQCTYKVSCADIMAIAARKSVSGGPYYDVELGRYDGRVSTKASVVLPHANFTLDQLNAYFSSLGGFTQSEMIALSGKNDRSATRTPHSPHSHSACDASRHVAAMSACADHLLLPAAGLCVNPGGHTLGAADCPFFQYRIGTDPTMDPNFAAQLKSTCSSNPTSGFAFLDPSPVTFDNAYFKNLQGGKGLLGSDQVLYSDWRSRGTVDHYATYQNAFFGDFVAAMTKLGRVGVKTAATGEIRRDCRFPN